MSEFPPELLALSPKRQVFVREYLIDLNGTQAAIRAGYSPKTANEQAARLLATASVSHVVEILMSQRQQALEIDAKWVLKGLVEVADRCMQKSPVMTFQRGEMVHATDNEGNNLWQFDSKGANRALELVGKHLGMFIDRAEVNVKHTYEQMSDNELQVMVQQELDRMGVKEIPHLKVINGGR